MNLKEPIVLQSQMKTIFKTGQCWQYNRYPDGTWRILTVSLIISNMWEYDISNIMCCHINEAFGCFFLWLFIHILAVL